MRVILRLLLCAWFCISGLVPSDGPFVGNWKLDASRSHIVDQMKVEKVNDNKYRFTFAGTDSETIAADGTDQPGLTGTTLSVTVDGPRSWKVVRKKEGHTMLTAIWTLSKDERTLRDTFTGFQTDGTAFTVDYVYERTEGTSGFPGTWESTSQQFDSVYELRIQPFKDDGLSFHVSTTGTTKNVTFDGNDQSNPGVAEGFTSAGRRVNEHALELTDKMNGKVIDTQELTVSEDGRTLTMTVHQAGRSKPTVLVFDRE